MKNPIYIHDAAMVSPLGKEGFGASKTYFCEHNGTLVGRLDAGAENQLQALQAENSQYGKLDRSALLAILAARQLKVSQKHMAVNIGSSRGATGLWEDFHKQFVENGSLPVPTSPLTTLGNLSSWVAQDLGTTSTAFSHSITCATAAHSILNAIAWLESGMASQFIAGGSEAPITDFTITQMKALRIYAQEKGEYPCLALDSMKKTNTMILGEAAACFLLSKTQSKNGLKITGYGTAIESLQSATSMTVDGQGFQKSMKAAIGNFAVSSIDAIVTHAPGTILGDQSELAAIEAVFSDHKPELYNNKWQMGHSLGASAAVNLYMALEVLNGQPIASIPYLKEQKRQFASDSKRVLINASGFGGNCVSILVEKEDQI